MTGLASRADLRRPERQVRGFRRLTRSLVDLDFDEVELEGTGVDDVA